MKKLFSLAVAFLTAITVMAQMPENMMFSGISTTKVSTMEITTPSDTVAFAMTGMTQGSLTLPAMKGMATIPSFTIHNITFSMSGGLVVTLPEQTFAATVTTDGGEKTIKGTSISGTYNIMENTMEITAVFTYGNMPMPVTYHITAYYIKPVTNKVTVVVGGAYPYTNESVTYRIRQYKEEGETLLDVEIPQFSLSGTVMGDLTLGTYTVKGLRYDNERGGFFRDYRYDNLSFYFKAMQNGVVIMDKEYPFNTEKDNNILVKLSGTDVAEIVNTFQMGAMPFGIVSTFGGTASGIGSIITDYRDSNKCYNLSGQWVSEHSKGIVIINGKKYLR